MKKKYILQIKRGYFWEDLITCSDKKVVDLYYFKFLNQSIRVRVVEVYYI